MEASSQKLYGEFCTRKEPPGRRQPLEFMSVLPHASWKATSEGSEKAARAARVPGSTRGLFNVTVSGSEAYPNTSAAQKPHRPRPETPRNRSPGRRCARDTSWKSTKGALSAASSCGAPGIPGRTRSRNRNARSRPRSRGSSSVALLSEATFALLSSDLQGGC